MELLIDELLRMFTRYINIFNFIFFNISFVRIENGKRIHENFGCLVLEINFHIKYMITPNEKLLFNFLSLSFLRRKRGKKTQSTTILFFFVKNRRSKKNKKQEAKM